MGDVENMIFLVTQSYATETRFATDAIIEIPTITAILAIFCVANSIAVAGCDALVAEFATENMQTIDAVLGIPDDVSECTIFVPY